MQGGFRHENRCSHPHTNAFAVSNPSIVHKPSKQSVTASEDYYSLSSGDSANIPIQFQSTNTIHRYQTPPSRYRTPAQSSSSTTNIARAQYAADDLTDPEVRKTPMRGEGKRRQSYPDSSSSDSAGVGPSSAAVAGAVPLGKGGIRRKPVPSTVMESEMDSPRSQEYVDATNARSSVVQDLSERRRRHHTRR